MIKLSVFTLFCSFAGRHFLYTHIEKNYRKNFNFDSTGNPLRSHISHEDLGRNTQRKNDFTLKLLSANIWGLEWMSEDKELRVARIVEFLQSSDYDIVFVQENWMFSDFKKIKSAFPYSTNFGSPNSVFCPEAR